MSNKGEKMEERDEEDATEGQEFREKEEGRRLTGEFGAGEKEEGRRGQWVTWPGRGVTCGRLCKGRGESGVALCWEEKARGFSHFRPTEVGHGRLENRIIVPSYIISLEMTYFHIYVVSMSVMTEKQDIRVIPAISPCSIDISGTSNKP